MTINFTVFIKLIFVFTTYVWLSGCGDVAITPKGEPNYFFKTNSEVCTEDPKDIGQYTKIMFVVDKSGSNGSTDSDKSLRHGSIKRFLDKNRNNKFIKWGFLKFNGTSAVSYIKDPNDNTQMFTANPADMDAALAKFKSEGDTGSTPYVPALSLVQSALNADLKKNAEFSDNYNIIFISDGKPEPESDNPDATIYDLVRGIVNLSAGNIHLSTVYYGSTSSSTANRLAKMAELGTGVFQDMNYTNDLNIDNFILGSSTQEPYIIKNFVVYNLNAANCDDGTVGGDSDSDGLCDKDEERYNVEFVKDNIRKTKMAGKLFSTTNRNSFDSVLSDLVYYKYIVTPGAEKPNTDPTKCDGIFTEPDLSTKCEKLFYTNSTPQGPTTAWTEKMSKNGDLKYFDSDGDGFLDYLEFIFFKDKSANINFNNISEKITGFGNLDKAYMLLNHLNPQAPMTETPYGVQFRKVQPNSRGQNCYSYHQDNLPLYYTQEVTPLQTGGSVNLAHSANENVILIYYTQVLERDPNSKAYLRYSYQKLKKDFSGNQTLSLDTGNFQIWKRPN